MKHPAKTAAALLVILAGLAPAARAAVLVYDPFDAAATASATGGIYQQGQQFGGATNSVVDGGHIIGFGTHPWTTTTGLLLADSSGRAAYNNNGQSAGSRYAQRQIDTTPTDSVLYLGATFNSSILLNAGTSNGFWAGFTDGSAVASTGQPAGQSGLLFGIDGYGNSMSLTLKGAGGSYKIADATVNTDYFILVKVTINLSGNDRVDVFVNPTGTTEPSTPTFTTSSYDFIDSMSDLNYGVLYVNPGTGTTGNVYIDNLEMTNTYASAVPEPPYAGAVALLVGALLLHRHGRRRSLTAVPGAC